MRFHEMASQFTRCLFRFRSHHLFAVAARFVMLFAGAADHRRERRCCRCAHHGVHLLQAGKGSHSQVSDDE